MLLTICPNCSAQFKVQPEQLNVRQGRVMCGRCRQVFNAFQSLTRVEEPMQAHVAGLQEVVAEQATYDEIAPSFSVADTAIVPVADALFLREEPLPLPAGFSASGPGSMAPPPGSEPTDSLSASVRPGRSMAKDVPSTYFRGGEDTSTEPAIDLTIDENPLLVEGPVSREAPIVASRAWGLGGFLLFIGLLVQAAYVFRTPLVSNYPQLRPVFSQLCDMAGCSLSWGRDEAVLKIDDSDLIETPGKPGRILLTATLVNRGKTKQDLPSLQLRLTDNANQIVVSRLLHPVDYLGRAIAKDEGLAPDKELYVNLSIDLDNKPLASGYGLLPFYP